MDVDKLAWIVNEFQKNEREITLQEVTIKRLRSQVDGLSEQLARAAFQDERVAATPADSGIEWLQEKACPIQTPQLITYRVRSDWREDVPSEEVETCTGDGATPETF